MEYKHYTVLREEAVELLNIKENGIYVDCTLGGAGHTRLILERLKGGRVIGIDRDSTAVENAERLIADERFTAVKSNFDEIDTVLESLGIEKVDGVLMDLGVSSHQLDTVDRGFSYSTAAPLDMRMDTAAALDAAQIVNGYSEDALADILWRYGEERLSRRIARAIVQKREGAPLTSTSELYDVVFDTVRGSKTDKLSSVKRVFQAIRIEVNAELASVSEGLEKAARLMNVGGRIVVISFHSLEDRIVKTAFNVLATGCTCPKDFPVCVCGKKPQFKLITKKPLLPSEKELDENSRSHSAKLRAAEKL